MLFYASHRVGAIPSGRRRGVAALRQVGLALAIYAALKAVAQASTVALIGLRVGSYLLVGCFLLAVAYWYRAAGEPSVAPSPTTLDTRTEAGD